MGRFHWQKSRFIDRICQNCLKFKRVPLYKMPVIPQKAHEPTDEARRLVESSSGLGLPHEQIGILVGIDDKTLRKYYRHELDMGKAKANGQIAKTLYSKAISGDTSSLIWWTKAQMRWSETVKQEVTGADGEPLQGIQVTFVKPNE